MPESPGAGLAQGLLGASRKEEVAGERPWQGRGSGTGRGAQPGPRMAEADPPLDQELEVGAGDPVWGGQKDPKQQRPEVLPSVPSVLDGGEEMGWGFLFGR